MNRGGLGARLLVALWGIPLLLVLTWLGGWWIIILFAGISLIGMNEYYNLHSDSKLSSIRALSFFSGAAIILGWKFGLDIIIWILIASFICLSFAGLLRGKSQHDLLVTYNGLIYIPLLAGTFIFVRNWGGEQNTGKLLAIGMWGTIWFVDTLAYLGGRLFGKRALAPEVSPKKTVEGFLFGLIGAILFSAVWYISGFVPFDIALALALSAGLAGQLGDLVESSMKREAAVKDAGDLLPGHGGILDRFDSMLMTAPVIALYLVIRVHLEFLM